MDSSRRSSNRLGFRSADGLSRSKGAIELKGTASSSYGAKLSSNVHANNKSRTNSMTMTRMIAKAAGDNESQESILDDSFSGSRSNRTDTTTTAQTKSSLELESNSRSDSKLSRLGSNRQRFSQTMGNRARSTEASSPPNEGGISCTTEIVVQYSKDESSNDEGSGKRHKLDWA